MTSSDQPFSNGSIVTACKIIADRISTNDEIMSLIEEYGLHHVVEHGGSISKTVGNLRNFAVKNPLYEVSTDFGKTTLARVLVTKAVNMYSGKYSSNPILEKFERYLNLDGYALTYAVKELWSGETEKTLSGFTVGMPTFVALPDSSNEVDRLLSENDFSTAQRHLGSARENIMQGDWVAANSQCRTFLEALTDAIADSLYEKQSTPLRGGLEKRQLLANNGFLSREKHEFGDGNGQSYLPGLAKLLHSDGSQPGISTQADALFRLQVVVITARWLLKRHQEYRLKTHSN